VDPRTKAVDIPVFHRAIQLPQARQIRAGRRPPPAACVTDHGTASLNSIFSLPNASFPSCTMHQISANPSAAPPSECSKFSHHAPRSINSGISAAHTAPAAPRAPWLRLTPLPGPLARHTPRLIGPRRFSASILDWDARDDPALESCQLRWCPGDDYNKKEERVALTLTAASGIRTAHLRQGLAPPAPPPPTKCK